MIPRGGEAPFDVFAGDGDTGGEPASSMASDELPDARYRPKGSSRRPSGLSA